MLMSTAVMLAAARGPALACLLFSASAVLVTLVSDVFVFSWRYQLPLLVTLVPAGALGISVITSAIRTRRTSGAGDGDTGGREIGRYASG